MKPKWHLKKKGRSLNMIWIVTVASFCGLLFQMKNWAAFFVFTPSIVFCLFWCFCGSSLGWLNLGLFVPNAPLGMITQNMTIIWRMTTVKTWKLTSHTTINTFNILMMLHLRNPIISILVLCILTSCQLPHFIYYVLNAWMKTDEQFVGSIALWNVYNSTEKHPIFVNILNSLLISQLNLVKG